MRPPSNDQRLVADRELTVGGAKHILHAEGGELTLRKLIIEIVWSVAFAASLGYAILVGQAGLAHLLVPMVGEYLAYIAALPILHLIFRQPDMRTPAWQCIRLWLGMLIVTPIVVYLRAYWCGSDARAQLTQDVLWLRSWIVEAHIHWPILVASLQAIRNLVHSTLHLVQHGPPFLGPGLGCAMRIGVLVLGVVIVPAFGMFLLGWLDQFGFRWKPTWNSQLPVWVLWALLIVSDFAALYFRWDVQQTLKRKGHPLKTH
jgi:hypothetical protein